MKTNWLFTGSALICLETGTVIALEDNRKRQNHNLKEDFYLVYKFGKNNTYFLCGNDQEFMEKILKMIAEEIRAIKIEELIENKMNELKKRIE